MILCTCSRCGRKHFADEVHSGSALRCAGCGDPVPIGAAARGNAVSKKIIQGEVVAARHWQAKKGVDAAKRLHRIPKFAYLGAAILICFTLVGWQMHVMTNTSKRTTLPTELRKKAESAIGSSNVFIEPLPPCQMALHRTGDAVLGSRRMSGKGVFTLDNGSDGDAVVTLISSVTGRRVRSIYIREHEKGSLRSLDPAVYRVNVAKGCNWNDSARRFSSEPSYFKMSHPYNFTEVNEDDRIKYSSWTLTLYKVFDGNVSQEPISEAEFRGEE